MRFTIATMAVLAAVTPALAVDFSYEGLPECVTKCLTKEVSTSDSKCDASDLSSQDDLIACTCDTVKGDDKLIDCLSNCDDDSSNTVIDALESKCDGLSIKSADDDDAAVTRSAPAVLAAAGLVAAFFL